MTAPIQTGAGEKPQAAGQIAQAGAPAPAAVPGPAAATPAPSPEGGNGNAPTTRDWERDAKTFQSRLDQQEAEFKPIREVMRKLGLDPMRTANSVEQLAAVWTHPEVGPVVQNLLQTGNVKWPSQSTPTPTPDDAYVDPDLKATKDELLGRIGELEKRLGAVSMTAQTSASQQVAQTLRSYETDFLSRFPLSEEEKAGFQQKMGDRFNWMVDKQPQALVQLQKETYEDLALPVLGRVVDVLTLGQRVASQKQAGTAARATDARLRAPTTGTETAPAPNGFDHTPTHTEIQAVARAALDALNRERESRR
jgi:hypothetical protein